MKRKLSITILLSVILFFLSTNICQSQNTKLKISTLPFSILDPYFPYLNGGAELILHDKLGIEFMYGERVLDRGLILTDQYDSIITPSLGRRFHIEVRLYNVLRKLFELKDQQDLYFGIAFRKISDTRNIALAYNIQQSSGPAKIDNENTAIQKELSILGVTIGHIFKYKRFIFDGGLELGLRHKKQKYIDNEYEERSFTPHQHWYWNKPQETIMASFNLRFKVSYLLF